MKAPAIRTILLNSLNAALIRLIAYRTMHSQYAPFSKETAHSLLAKGLFRMFYRVTRLLCRCMQNEFLDNMAYAFLIVR